MPRIPFSHLNQMIEQLNSNFSTLSYYAIKVGSAVTGSKWQILLCLSADKSTVILEAVSRKELAFKLEGFLKGLEVSKQFVEGKF